jgi:hypothetical protein
MFKPKEMNLSPQVLTSILDSIYKNSRERGTDLEVLAIMVASATKGYKQSLGTEQAAMLFYHLADQLATDTLDNGESDSDIGDEQ